jgi:ribonuclease Z
MAEMYFLGTGGSVATRKRDNTSVLIPGKGGLLLVDCTGNIVQKIKRLGYEPRQVRFLFLTHIHPDHVFALPSLIHGLMFEEGEILLLGSAETVSFARRLLDLFDLRRREFRTRVVFKILRPGKRIRLDAATSALALKTPHHSSSLAYRFYLERIKKEVLISGDTPLHPPLFAAARGIDYLIHDASAPSRYFRKYPALYKMHTAARDLGRLSRKASVRCLIPCHFLGELDFSLAEVRKEIRREFKGKLIIPRDLRKIPL